MSEFDGRVALVTGAAGKGLGQATARRLASGGATVVVTDIHERRTGEVAEAIAADYPDVRVAGFALDAGDRDQIDAVIGEVTSTLGPVRILVNNAAVNVIGSIFDYDPENWDWCLRVNLSGPWYLCRAVMPLMRDAGGGAIVNVSSFAADVGGGGVEAPYAISKGGLNVLTRCVRARRRPVRDSREHGLVRRDRRHQVRRRPSRDHRQRRVAEPARAAIRTPTRSPTRSRSSRPTVPGTSPARSSASPPAHI